MSMVINTLTVDCHDPKAVADFWIAALGGSSSRSRRKA